MVVESKYKGWLDPDNSEIYPKEGRYVTNQLLMVMMCDACMPTDDLLKGFC